MPLLTRPTLPGTNTVIFGHDDHFEAVKGVYPEPQGIGYILQPDGEKASRSSLVYCLLSGQHSEKDSHSDPWSFDLKDGQNLTFAWYVANTQGIVEKDNGHVDLGRVSTKIKAIYLS